MSYPSSGRCVANECRNVCRRARFANAGLSCPARAAMARVRGETCAEHAAHDCRKTRRRPPWKIRDKSPRWCNPRLGMPQTIMLLRDLHGRRRVFPACGAHVLAPNARHRESSVVRRVAVILILAEEPASSRTAPSPRKVDGRRRGGNRASPRAALRSPSDAPSGTGSSLCLARGVERAAASDLLRHRR